MAYISNSWQKALVVAAPAVFLLWLAIFGSLDSAASFFLLHLAVYMIHQIEEHYFPGGFRQFTNENVFHSGQDNFPVSKPGVALVNIGYVWLPLAIAAAAPSSCYLLGVAWFGLSFMNALSHIGTSLRLRRYNPGVVTAALGLLPLSILFFQFEAATGALSAAGIAAALVTGIVLHVPVAALFVIPFEMAKRAARAATAGSET